MTRPAVISLFSGAGGMCLGFEQAGFDIPVAVEIDEIHARTHQQNFFIKDWRTICEPVETMEGWELREATRPAETVVLVGGPPCQSFSVQGKREPSDPRSSLIDHFVRLVSEIEPDYFVLENVKGLTQGHCLPVLEQAIAQLKALGYTLPPWQILNAKDYGVPQSRERLFLLGSKAGLPPVEYPKPTYTVTVLEALQDIPNNSAADDSGQVEDFPVIRRPFSAYAQEMRTLTRQSWHAGYQRPTFYKFQNCHRTKHKPETVARFSNTAPGDRDQVSRFMRLHPDGVAPTLRAGTDSKRGRHTAPRPIHYFYPRCITVRESARLHGFPDWFQFHNSIWHGARQVGNAVPPPLARAIASEVLKSIYSI